MLRKNLKLRTYKSGSGAYVFPFTERAKLERLYERYGIVTEGAPEEETKQAGEDAGAFLEEGGNTDVTGLYEG